MPTPDSIKESKFTHWFHELPALLRLLFTIVLAAITFFLTAGVAAPLRYMSVWLAFAISNLAFSAITMFTAHPKEVSKIAKSQDVNPSVVFLVSLIASMSSLFAVVLLMRILPNAGDSGFYHHVIFSVSSLGCSWLLIHTIFSFRYAHLFYTCESEEKGVRKTYRGGLEFPNDKTPDYLDFAYFSFVIGMTFQVSDVQVTSSTIRRLALLHGLLSFLFNTVILAMSINIIAGIVQK